MDHTLQVLANLAVAVFVISSMLSMGLSLTMQQILEPLRNGRLVILALVLNFLVVPALAHELRNEMEGTLSRVLEAQGMPSGTW